jgi:hypothetical protein
MSKDTKWRMAAGVAAVLPFSTVFEGGRVANPDVWLALLGAAWIGAACLGGLAAARLGRDGIGWAVVGMLCVGLPLVFVALAGRPSQAPQAQPIARVIPEAKGPMRLFSPTYHRTVVLPVLRERLRPGGEVGPSASVAGFSIGRAITLVFLELVLIILMVVGAQNYSSLVGKAMLALGAGGLLFLLIASTRAQLALEERPSLADLRLSPFLFMALLGLNVGLGLAFAYPAIWFFPLAVLGGATVGYLSGIFAGVWINYLGEMADSVELALTVGCMVLCMALIAILVVSV